EERERVHQGSFAAKITADRDRIEADAILRNADRSRHMSSRNMRAFVGHPEIDNAVGADRDEAGMRLDVALMHRGYAKAMLEDFVRPGEGACDIAVAHLQ